MNQERSKGTLEQSTGHMQFHRPGKFHSIIAQKKAIFFQAAYVAASEPTDSVGRSHRMTYPFLVSSPVLCVTCMYNVSLGHTESFFLLNSTFFAVL